MSLTGAERIARYRARRKAEGRNDTSRRFRAEHRRSWKQEHKDDEREFVGCDGEGCGVDDLGRQLYMLFRMGDRELFTGSRLGTEELLDFICDEPASSLLVGFAFGYDVTMILRDLSVRQQKRLFEPKTFGQGKSPFVWYKGFDIDYLPKQYLRVRRAKVERQLDGREKRVPVKGSARTIFETFGFFQKSFLKACKDFKVGTAEQLQMIDRNKERRGSFVGIDQEVRDYCAMECQFLAELMGKLRGYCKEAGIKPRTWNGAGKLAQALHGKNGTLRARQLDLIPKEVHNLANMAYYGGRFEVTRIGGIHDTVHEYDIRSAYPANMRRLPCLAHGRWVETDAGSLRSVSDDGLFIAPATFRAMDKQLSLGGFPVRSQLGHLYWALRGGGVYWSPEIWSARRLGIHVTLSKGYQYIKDCDCRPFDWVGQLYDYRKSIGAQGQGYPIKLGINALYGTLAQRVGHGAFTNMIWAGLITAFTRAQLNDAICGHTDKVVMIATDAIYSLDPLPLDVGENLGQWEHTELPGLFIVQPGLYWSPELRKRKSRGLSGKFFEEAGRTQSFEDAWSRFFDLGAKSKLDVPFPQVEVPVPGFIGLKLALARNKPELAGTWVNDKRSISFDYRNKRQGHEWREGHILTGPKHGFPGLVSLPHRDFLASGGHEPWEAARLMLEEQPDYVDLGIPFRE